MRFPIRFTGANQLMGVMGMTPSRCYVDVDEHHLRVRMGMWFELDADRTVVRAAAPDPRRVLAWGVHGWRGRWLVNGSSSGIVRVALDPAPRAWLGPVPLRVRELRVSVDDPDGLVAALAPTPSGGSPPPDDDAGADRRTDVD